MKELIEGLLPSVDELVALLEYYDNSTYRTAVVNLVEKLQEAGLTGFEETKVLYDPDRHQLFESHYSENYDFPTVTTCHLRGYELNGELIRKSVVDVHFPKETEDKIVNMEMPNG
jgi:molecular chaperone GrpE (heat shock protein)